MIDNLEIRLSGQQDVVPLEHHYGDAFKEEEIFSLVSELLADAPAVLSLMAVTAEALVGHVMFTPCHIANSDARVVLLGPLAVATRWQRKGVGNALVRLGLDRLVDQGVVRVLVLGDPAYYKRFGFKPEGDIQPPYPLPEQWRDAWQSLELGGVNLDLRGRLKVPQPWQREELWGP